MNGLGKKRDTDEEPYPDPGRAGQRPAKLMINISQRVTALKPGSEADRDALKVAETSAAQSNEVTIKLMQRLLTAESRIKTFLKSQKDAEARLADASLQLRAHSRASLSANRESTMRKDLDAKELSIATTTECPVCYSQANAPGHEPYRLGCPDGHHLCYECVYIMFARSRKPAQDCPYCRGLLKRPPFLDRVTLALVHCLLPAHSPSENDLIITAPPSPVWINLMKWPPTAAGARSVRRRLETRQAEETPPPSAGIQSGDEVGITMMDL